MRVILKSLAVLGCLLFVADTAQAAVFPVGQFAEHKFDQEDGRGNSDRGRNDRQASDHRDLPLYSLTTTDRRGERELPSRGHDVDRRPVFSSSDLLPYIALSSHHRGRYDQWGPSRFFFHHNWSGHGGYKPPVPSVPLPAALPLFGAGLAGLAILRRRGRKTDNTNEQMK